MLKTLILLCHLLVYSVFDLNIWSVSIRVSYLTMIIRLLGEHGTYKNLP